MTSSAQVPVRCPAHDLVLHDGPEALLELAARFVRGGVDKGDQVVVVGEPAFVDDLRAATRGVTGVHLIREAARNRFPGRDMRRFADLLAALVRAPSPIRVINQMPPMTADEWLEWRRYEAAANVLLAPYPVWGTCAYDASVLEPAMLDDLLASHSHVTTPIGRRASERFEDLDERVHGYLDVPPHPIEATPPALTLDDPSAATARRAVRDLAHRAGLPSDATDFAVLAASETVTNGSLHGRPPVAVRGWVGDGRVTVTVSDEGPGPHPLVGLLPVPVDSESGRGMLILHQLIADLHHRTDGTGYTVRFSIDGARPA